jgi:hypothetical protein
MGELDALNLTRRAWWCLGVLRTSLGQSAQFWGDSAFALIAAPVLVLVWVTAFWLVDRWVRMGQPE